MKLLTTLILTFTLFSAAPVYAAPGKGVSLDQVVNRIYQQGNRKVISAHTVGKGKNRVHQVKTLSDDGRLRTERYDSRTGRRAR